MRQKAKQKLPPDTIALVETLPFELRGYRFTEVLGSGSFAVVLRCYHVGSSRYFAAKVIHKNRKRGSDPCGYDSDDSSSNAYRIPSNCLENDKTLNDQNRTSNPTNILSGRPNNDTNNIGEMNKTKRIDVVNSEINALVRLNHPNIIKLYDSFEENDHLFMILQLCENGTLSSIIKNSRGIDPQLLVPFMKQILSAVAFCHSQKIAHRDIKPANVFLDGYTRPLLADFGFATIIQNDALTKKFCGSFPYRSPENLQQLPHDAFKSDIWALGVTFYEMATGGSPWPTHAPDSASKAILSGSYHIPEWVPKTISGVIKKMLVVDPNSRFSAAQLLESPFLIVGSSINCSFFDNRPRINYCTTIPLSTAPSSPTSSPSSNSKSNLQANLKLQSSVNWSRANSQATYTLTFPTQGNANQQSITQFDTSSEKGRTLICSLVNRQRLDQRVVIPGKVYLGPSKLRINRSSSIPVEKTFM